MMSARIECGLPRAFIEEPTAGQMPGERMGRMGSGAAGWLNPGSYCHCHRLARLITETLIEGTAVAVLERLPGFVVNDNAPSLRHLSAERGGNAHQVRFVDLVLRRGVDDADQPAIVDLLRVGPEGGVAAGGIARAGRPVVGRPVRIHVHRVS